MQVISISPTGEVSGLQVKPGKGLDLRKLGRAKIERASEIVWDDTAQRWYVKIMKGKYAGRVLDADLILETMSDEHVCVLPPHGQVRAGVLLWLDYDEAVKGEIAFLDHVRLTQGPDAL